MDAMNEVVPSDYVFRVTKKFISTATRVLRKLQFFLNPTNFPKSIEADAHVASI